MSGNMMTLPPEGSLQIDPLGSPGLSRELEQTVHAPAQATRGQTAQRGKCIRMADARGTRVPRAPKAGTPLETTQSGCDPTALVCAG